MMSKTHISIGTACALFVAINIKLYFVNKKGKEK